MNDKSPLLLLPMLELPGIPRWTSERLANHASTIDKLERWVPHELADTAVAQFVENTLDRIAGNTYRDDPLDLVRQVASRLEKDGRPNVHRVLDRFMRNAIEIEKIVTTRLLGDRGSIWANFTRLEALFFRKQFILLWLDMLTYARMHHPSWEEAVPLKNCLVPEGRAYYGRVPVNFKPSQAERFQYVLRPDAGGDWEEQFGRLLLTACCALGDDCFGIWRSFEKSAWEEVGLNRGPLTILEADGRTLSLERSGHNTYAISPIKPDELAAWGIDVKPAAKSEPTKPAPWVRIVERLHDIAREQRSVDAAYALEEATDDLDLARKDFALQTDDLDLERKEIELQSEARGLIEVLRTSNCLPHPVTDVVRDDVNIALRAMTNVLSEYEDDWLDDTMREIFGD